ncbi:hypothetical protein K504DRAFT_212282 [Pleomassaria siparia CBS 279.74]|uniref:Uncharacterized protein n=1 Tax=Pleomassaria siparia CBS 279.74 TaxID=1314801 RepID=A0A6G1KIX6_9PLEO|nr:hypothetical protein K504DRAFT_212282 [Pleomassaria siparia CBS 279.74]
MLRLAIPGTVFFFITANTRNGGLFAFSTSGNQRCSFAYAKSSPYPFPITDFHRWTMVVLWAQTFCLTHGRLHLGNTGVLFWMVISQPNISVGR